jgi:hypothetical protein
VEEEQEEAALGVGVTSHVFGRVTRGVTQSCGNK